MRQGRENGESFEKSEHSRLGGFEAIGASSPKCLILGSFPSVRSLDIGEYYGHERNHFWEIVGRVLGFDHKIDYPQKKEALAQAGIALWDVLASCERKGSLDKDIRDETPNRVAEFLASLPTIERIGLNGGKAATAFFTYVIGPDRDARAKDASTAGYPPLTARDLVIGTILDWMPNFAPGRQIRVMRLPSSSPVPTRDFRRIQDKLAIWSKFLR